MKHSVQPPAVDSKTTQGSADQWDAIWKSYSSSSNESSMRKLFTRNSPATIYQFWQRCYFEDLLQLVEPQATWKFLELASGRGTTSMYLANSGMDDITLVDLSATALEQATKNFAAEGLAVPQLVIANAERTGLPNALFDCIYNVGVLEHFEDPSGILAESHRLLKSGGRIFMPIVPSLPFSRSLVCRAFFNPVSILRRLARNILKRSTAKEAEMVRTNRGPEGYERLAEQAGFHSVRCIPYNPYWKVNRDGSIIAQSIALPAYKFHYGIKRMLKFRPSLKTWTATACCLLLIGTKPKK